MNNRERLVKVLHYENYDRLPILHFGFWEETLDKWAQEGFLTPEELRLAKQGDAMPGQVALNARLGFDDDYGRALGVRTGLLRGFESKVIEKLPDGTRKVLNGDGVIVLQRDGAGSIPAEVDYLLKGRKEWEELYLPKLQFDKSRIDLSWVICGEKMCRFNEGGREFLMGDRDCHYMLNTGSLYGVIRNYVGMENLCYLQADDEDLYDEMIDTVGDLCYKCTKYALESGAKFDIGHFWEDICFKSGPLVNPSVFRAKVGPHYKKITSLLNKYGIDIVSLDCDGKIDDLVPIWLENGVNTMFPIEVGTWNASIKPWREKYGRELRGVGGMRKHVFAEDYASVDSEIERLKPLVDLGGYIPCPDHRIAPDAKWENVCYYTERMRAVFG